MLAACACALPLDDADGDGVADEIGTRQQSIINGEVTGDYPSTGLLLFSDNFETATVGCTATLIGCQTVLTAAHCVCPEDVYSGTCAVQPRGLFFQHAGYYEVAEINVHPDYRRLSNSALEHDIAVITLTEPVSGIEPTPIQMEQPALGPATIVGFGRTSESLHDYGVKRTGTAQLTACDGNESDAQHLCWRNDSLLCQGDSGGPLFVGEGDAMTIAGVSSYVYGCTGKSVDMNVSASTDFILEIGGDDVGASRCDEAVDAVGQGSVTAHTESGNLSVNEGDSFEVDVPPGTSELRVSLNGNVLDIEVPNNVVPVNFDLFVKQGAEALDFDNDCGATEQGSTGYCRFKSPVPGKWHMMVRNTRSEGTYQITTTLIGDAPISSPDQYEAPGALQIYSDGGVLTNDKETSRGQLQAELVDAPENGQVQLAPDGSFVYMPAEGFLGADSFTYKATDGSYESQPTTVDIDVTDYASPDDLDNNVSGGCAAAGAGPSTGWLWILGASLLLWRRRRD